MTLRVRQGPLAIMHHPRPLPRAVGRLGKPGQTSCHAQADAGAVPTGRTLPLSFIISHLTLCIAHALTAGERRRGRCVRSNKEGEGRDRPSRHPAPSRPLPPVGSAAADVWSVPRTFRPQGRVGDAPGVAGRRGTVRRRPSAAFGRGGRLWGRRPPGGPVRPAESPGPERKVGDPGGHGGSPGSPQPPSSETGRFHSNRLAAGGASAVQAARGCWPKLLALRRRARYKRRDAARAVVKERGSSVPQG